MNKMKLHEGSGLVKHLPQSPPDVQPHLPSHSPNHTPQDKKKSSFKGYTHGCSFPSSIVSQQGSDIPLIEVEAEVVHCSFGSINLCYAVEGDSQGEVSGLWFHVRVGGTFDTKEKGQGQLPQCSSCCATSLI